MSHRLPFNIPPALRALASPSDQIAQQVLEISAAHAGLQAIVLGGSLAGSVPREDGDLDLWLFVDAVDPAVAALKYAAAELPHLTHLYDAGHVPWFGRLLTLLFYPGCEFGIDVGFATPADSAHINTGPGAIVLWARPSARSLIDPALAPRNFRCSPSQRAERVLINLVKLAKALERGEKWGAAEYVARARRELIGIFRDAHPSAPVWYERPDREVEALLAEEQRNALLGTFSSLQREDLSADGRALARLTLRHAKATLAPGLAAALRGVCMRLAGVDPLASPRVGLVGAGRMGGRIGQHLLDLGLDLTVVEPAREQAVKLAQLGATLRSPTELCDRDVVLLALAEPSQTNKVIEEILLSGPKRAVFVDLSTNSPSAAKELGVRCTAAGHGFLDSPMSGGTWAAGEGRLTLMIGGEARDLAQARPILSMFASRMIHAGPLGFGCTAKLLHNMVGELEVQGFAEAFCVGTQMGLAPDVLYACLAGGMAASPVLTKIYGSWMRGETTVNIPIDMAAKDQRLLLDTALEFGVSLTWTEAVHRRLSELQARGLGERDISGTISWFETVHKVSVGRISPPRQSDTSPEPRNKIGTSLPAAKELKA